MGPLDESGAHTSARTHGHGSSPDAVMEGTVHPLTAKLVPKSVSKLSAAPRSSAVTTAGCVGLLSQLAAPDSRSTERVSTVLANRGSRSRRLEGA